LSSETVQQKSTKELVNAAPLNNETHDVGPDAERSAYTSEAPFSVFRRSTPFRAGSMPPPNKISRFVHPSASNKPKAQPQITTSRMFQNVSKHLSMRFGSENSSLDSPKNVTKESDACLPQAVHSHEPQTRQLHSLANTHQNQQNLQLERFEFKNTGHDSNAMALPSEGPHAILLEPPSKRRKLVTPNDAKRSVISPEMVSLSYLSGRGCEVKAYAI
jgi:hypothetical protein